MRRTNALRTPTQASARRSAPRPNLLAFPTNRAVPPVTTATPATALAARLASTEVRILDRIAEADEAAGTRAALATEELALALAEQRTTLALGRDRSVVSWPTLAAALVAVAALPTAGLRVSGVVATVLSVGFAPSLSRLARRTKKGGTYGRA